MWKLNKIEARNLCAFRKLEYTLHQGVPTLIFGDNRDNESQRSNGSGKSALIECIAIGITGSPLRKIKNEEIVNDNSDECFVALEFTNDSSTEVLRVEREIFRKGSSSVCCHIERDGVQVTTGEVVHPSVDAYNRYILEKLGLSRDEVLNNFILSKHRYQEFLSCSDKEKKDIINRFSNGILVDQAIDKILEDILPIEARQKDMELKIAGMDGRIDMLVEQIQQQQDNREEKARTKAEKIKGIQESITVKRTLIRDKKMEISAVDDMLKTISDTDKELQTLENGENSFEECVANIRSAIIPLVAERMTDWGSFIDTKKKEIAEAEEEVKKWETIIEQADQKIEAVKSEYKSLENEFKVFSNSYGERNEGFVNELKGLDDQIKEADRKNEELKSQKRTVVAAIELLSGKLAGTVNCPSCGYEFLVSDKEFDVEATQKELGEKKETLESVSGQLTDMDTGIEKLYQSRTHVTEESRKLSGTQSEWSTKIAQAKRDVQTAEYEMEGNRINLKKVQDIIASRQAEIGEVRRKLFDEAFGLIDEKNKSLERRKSGLFEDMNTARSSIDTLEETIIELNKVSGDELIDSLKASLKQARLQANDYLQDKNVIDQELLTLRKQNDYFAQFKTYLANTKIEALSKITNEFLESIGSDIRIKFSGYTVLKTGKVREKISVSLIRDGLDCGSFGKFSAGESARVNLATILAMQKLINSNCDTDKGLDLLVLDEILEAVDEDGLSFMFAALSKLGTTSLVVSHGNIAESYPYKIMVVKENGESRIEQ